MTLDQLQVIDIIVKTGSFRAAAEKLNRAQSAVSYAVKNLEEELGLALFSREGYRPVLTDEGKAIYEKGLRVLYEAQGLRRLGEQYSQGVEPVIHLAVEALYPLEYLWPILKTFSEQQPSTQLKLSVEVMGAAHSVANEQAQIGIGSNLLLDSGTQKLQQEPLKNIRMIPVVSPKHPMGKIKSAIYQAELVSFVQIILKSTAKEAENIKAGIPEGSLTWSVPNFEVKRQLLINALGWGNMPEHLISDDLKVGRLVKLKVKDFQDPKVQLQLMKKKNYSLGPSGRRLWELICNIK